MFIWHLKYFLTAPLERIKKRFVPVEFTHHLQTLHDIYLIEVHTKTPKTGREIFNLTMALIHYANNKKIL